MAGLHNIILPNGQTAQVSDAELGDWMGRGAMGQAEFAAANPGVSPGNYNLGSAWNPDTGTSSSGLNFPGAYNPLFSPSWQPSQPAGGGGPGFAGTFPPMGFGGGPVGGYGGGQGFGFGGYQMPDFAGMFSRMMQPLQNQFTAFGQQQQDVMGQLNSLQQQQNAFQNRGFGFNAPLNQSGYYFRGIT